MKTYDDMPSDGCIIVKRWDGKRSQGFHVESVEYMGIDRDFVQVWATPMSITTGATSGAPRIVSLRFGLDEITAMPDAQLARRVRAERRAGNPTPLLGALMSGLSR